MKYFFTKVGLATIFLGGSFLIATVETKKVLTVGGVTCDFFLEMDGKGLDYISLTDEGKRVSFIAFHEGNKVDLTGLHQYSGGGAGNAAVSFSKQGVETAVFCKVGNDSFGKSILEEFNNFGISTKHVLVDEKLTTASSFIISSQSGERTILVNRGANTNIKLESFASSVLEEVDGIYITALSGKSAEILLPILQMAHEKNILVALNPGVAQLKGGKNCILNGLKFIDILILNEVEAAVLAETFCNCGFNLSNKQLENSNNKNIPEFLQKPIFAKGERMVSLTDFCSSLIALGPKIVLVTNGSAGAYAFSEKAVFYHAILPVNVVNTIGAGDAFGSTFVGSFLSGKNIEQSMRFATINSASVVGVEDAKSGLLSKKEIEERSLEIRRDFFSQFLIY
ncbi:TPA: carbohydrate kinase [Candidatus Dependentiae bacterium]|nr:MAG: Carbohydrate/purine kinase pfkB family protein [candidate division TM6 bacterium GW2011_GWE2_31_21]KKP52985.1 MAG: Carbohydrate/purine kinase pfkB family protein [candidate division TM6 bacterium GW2011_GWF2_33_332]HBS47777.1 carbohydrate kinase [Candidatus Dependentiae bacterium]HBZ73247.1 carbohydrate kinase [Candidatus Dependentiae bacterium]